MKKLQIVISGSIILLLWATSLFADFFNNRNILPGTKAALMGGAFTALSEDTSGAYYNPAGLAFVKDTLVQVNASLYTFQNFTRKGEMDTHELQNFSVLPSTFGISTHFGRFTLALSIIQLDNFKFTSLSTETSSSNKVEVETETYLMGLSAGIRITNFLSFGISIFYHYYSAETNFFNEDGTKVEIDQNQITSGGLIPQVGVKLHFSRINIGISYSMETIHTNGENNYSSLSTALPSPYYFRDTCKGDVRLPHKLSTGLAWVDKKFKVALDFIYYFKMSYSAPNEIMHTSNSDWTHKERNHFDISLGGEYYLTQKFSLLAGFYTNTSGASSSYDRSDLINMFGGTFGFAYSGEKVSTHVGVNLTYGKSDWQGVYPGKWERFAISLIVGGGTSF